MSVPAHAIYIILSFRQIIEFLEVSNSLAQHLDLGKIANIANYPPDVNYNSC